MPNGEKNNYDIETLLSIVANEIDAAYVIDAENDSYEAVKYNPMFFDLFKDSGSYLELSRILMFHFSDSSKNITSVYHVFLPKLNKFDGKYSRRVKIFYHDNPVIIQMSLYPLSDTGKHIMFLVEMDNCEYIQDFLTIEKENVIKSAYLFSMYVDLANDLCNSVSVTEMSDDPMNYTGLRYSQWRMMIVNMIFPDDQPMFLEYTDPEYIKKHLRRRRSSSFDCQMQNLQGKFIWVKLIFSRIETVNNDDFRFVFMVQDIHESSIRLIDDLRKYEELSNLDSLTRIFNHGKIENELYRYMDIRKDENMTLSLFMLDIDFFKKVNDTFGHAAGDAVLKQLVAIANERFQDYDITFGRWGGEEFIGICRGMGSKQLLEIAEKLRRSISEYNFDMAGHVTCSMGIIEISDDEETEEAFERLDKALYAAKSNGRNCIVCG